MTAGLLAQLVEQRTFNPTVLGSSPRRPKMSPSSSQAQDTSLSSWRRGFKSRWGRQAHLETIRDGLFFSRNLFIDQLCWSWRCGGVTLLAMSQVLENIQFVKRHAQSHGRAILQKLGEHKLPRAEWLTGSHGAAIRVAGEHDAHFERLVVLIPCPPDGDGERFRKWAEQRVEHLDWYMEASNTGRVVQTVFGERQAAAVLMRRLGRAPGEPGSGLPQPEDALKVVTRFLANVERYVLNIGDDDLRYVRALKLYRIPRRNVSDEYVLGLDILPTLIGVDGDSMPINPLTLTRGVIGEFAELYDAQRRSPAKLPSVFRWGRRRKAVKRRKLLEGLVDELDRLCARIDLERPDLNMVRTWVSALVPAKKASNSSTQVTIGIVLVCAILAWWLAH